MNISPVHKPGAGQGGTVNNFFIRGVRYIVSRLFITILLLALYCALFARFNVQDFLLNILTLTAVAASFDAARLRIQKHRKVGFRLTFLMTFIAASIFILFTDVTSDFSFEYIAKHYESVGDYSAEFSLLKSLAQKGHTKAQGCLALMYEYGKPVPKNIEKAIYWNKEAAAQGSVAADIALFRLYRDAGNCVEARQYISEAVTRKNYFANYVYGMALLRGECFTVDHEKGFVYIKSAADAGLKRAVEQLEVMYRYGVGTKKNVEEANRLHSTLNKSAE